MLATCQVDRFACSVPTKRGTTLIPFFGNIAFDAGGQIEDKKPVFVRFVAAVFHAFPR